MPRLPARLTKSKKPQIAGNRYPKLWPAEFVAEFVPFGKISRVDVPEPPLNCAGENEQTNSAGSESPQDRLTVCLKSPRPDTVTVKEAWEFMPCDAFMLNRNPRPLEGHSSVKTGETAATAADFPEKLAVRV